ncbi:MAG: branched-chain amino acid ABC transporter permease [Candidatus Dormibacteraeota bacterium]|nr:branched-chain amino acid ABC transporter permease [Candidatus Dormibacteraeota bacterium]
MNATGDKTPAGPVAPIAQAAPRARQPRPRALIGWIAVGLVVLLALVAPFLVPTFWLSQILTKALWLGIAAASVIYLNRDGGMVSLGQVGIYAVAGFTMANLVTAFGGRHLGWDPWLATVTAIVAATLFGLLIGAIASRSYGIYFLMITLAVSVIVFYFFAQVTTLSGYGGIRNVTTPALIGNPVTDPTGLYYVALVASVAVFVGLRYLSRTPFGLALQGIRDDPGRMRALGFNIPLHRTLAFGVAALIAAIAGVLSVWYTTQISPGGVNISQTINILVIAVIGGLYRLPGAWVGALLFTILDNYSRVWLPTIGDWIGPDRFETVLGLIFLVIVLVSPGGLVGAWESLVARAGRGLGSRGGPESDAAAAPPV